MCSNAYNPWYILYIYFQIDRTGNLSQYDKLQASIILQMMIQKLFMCFGDSYTDTWLWVITM